MPHTKEDNYPHSYTIDLSFIVDFKAMHMKRSKKCFSLVARVEIIDSTKQ